MGRKLVILGAASVALEVLEMAATLGYDVDCMVDETLPDSGAPKTRYGIPVARSLDPWLDDPQVSFAIAIGDNQQRARVLARLLVTLHESRFPTLVHPDASISPFSELGGGSFIMGGTRILANAVVEGFNYINANCVIAHDNVIAPFASLGAGAALGGWCSVGARSFVGINSAVREKTSIGQDVVVGAASFVNRDLDDRVVAVGSPARVLRFREPDDPYLR